MPISQQYLLGNLWLFFQSLFLASIATLIINIKLLSTVAILYAYNIIVVPCPGKGQSFVGGCNPFNATCSNPNPGILCDVGFCACPSGQVLDEFTNTCVNVSQCGK